MTWEECRRDFPILEQRIGSHPLCYLDKGATTQLPEPVLREMELQYHGYEANVHRGIHYLSEASTRRMEDAREDIRRFLGAASMDEIIFTSGCTAAINLVARSLSFSGLTMGDEILVTQMEHHSNFLPWQEACRRTGAAFRVVPVLPDGRLDLERFSQMLTEQTRLVAITWVSNVTGCVNPVETIIHMAHQKGALVLVDCIGRMVEGVLPSEECFTEESHWNGLLEYPQYTHPVEWNGRRIPDILLSGDHGKIAKWRHEMSLRNTLIKRPDLLEKAELSQKDRWLVAQMKAEQAAKDGNDSNAAQTDGETDRK